MLAGNWAREQTSTFALGAQLTLEFNLFAVTTFPWNSIVTLVPSGHS